LGSFLKFSERGTNLRTEVIAGLTTFMTMAYIVFVNPAILDT
jgi:AGZA family xanthine/uracil permease-like MFS transporter